MIYHWCSVAEWESVDGSYVAPSLAEEGFIHFSFRDQVARTASALDRGRLDLVLLSVDDANLKVIVEDSYGVGEEFPHIYGPIPVAAIANVTPFPCEPDGSFTFPEKAGLSAEA